MNRRAHALGIPEKDLEKALQLARYFRATLASEKLDPRATRIALLYANLVERATHELSFIESMEVVDIAKELFEKMKDEGVL